MKSSHIQKQKKHSKFIFSKKRSPLFLRLFKKRHNPQEITSFSRQFASLLSAGISVTAALTVILKGFNTSSLYSSIHAIKQKIEQGNTVSSAFHQFPDLFDELYCGLIEIGELTGTLDKTFDQIAHYQEKSGALKRKIRSMMFYPCLVLILGVFVFFYLLTTVVPTFKDLFDSLQVELPLVTQTLINFSTFLQKFGFLLLLATLSLISVMIQLYRKNPGFKARLHYCSLKIPLFGRFLQLASMIAFTRAFMITQTAGIPIDKALQVIYRLIPNLAYATALQQVETKVSQGLRIHQAMLSLEIFPPLLIQMIAIGENAGTLERMLSTVTLLYEEILDTALSGLTTLIEPIMMIVLGLGVGGLVIAIYLPIFKMSALF